MPYLNETGLAYYNEKLQPWIASQPVKTIPSSLYPWTQTDKAGAVTCWPVGDTPLLPTVNFLFTETGPTEGTKGPDNPSTIAGVSEVKVTRCGKNVLPISGIASTASVTVTANAETGGIHLSGTTSGATWLNLPGLEVLRRGQTYAFSLSGDAPSGVVLKMFVKATSTSSWSSSAIGSISSGGSASYTIPSDLFATWFRLDVPASTTLNCDCYIQVELDSTATAFEPYDGADYTLDLGSTYYGGSVDLATGVMTVTSQKVLLDASCSFGYYAGASDDSLAAVVVQINSLPVANGVFVTGRCACNKFPIHAKINGEESISLTSPTYPFFSKQIRVYLKWTTLGVSSSASSQEIIAAAKAWFTENQVELVVTYEGYSSTVTLTPTQIHSLSQPDKYTPRLNTIYTDASAVQVGYVKSPIREEFELQQAIVGQGGNV